MDYLYRIGILMGYTLMVASALSQQYPASPKNYATPPYQPAKANYQQDYKAPAYGNYAPNYGRVANYTSYSAPSASILLQSGNVIVATGETSAVNVAVPDGTEYYVNKQNELIRVDPDGLFQHTQTRVATYVEYVYRAYDDSVWFTDTTEFSDVWRLRWKDAPEKIPGQPNPVNFETVTPRSWDNGFAVAADGSLWQYTSKQWIRHKEVNYNAQDSGIGNDGTLTYLGKDNILYMWDWDSRSWVVFQTGVTAWDLYTMDVVVVCDLQYYCKKWSFGKFINTGESCTGVSMTKDSFYCVTPQEQVKLVPYF